MSEKIERTPNFIVDYLKIMEKKWIQHLYMSI